MNPAEAAEHVALRAAKLANISRSAGLIALAQLLDMAALEAANHIRFFPADSHDDSATTSRRKSKRKK